MVLHNPNNWHWVNKDVSAWTQEYLTKELVGLSATQDDIHVEINKILSMEGDVDVSQRKGKVITIFDVRLQLEWTGSVPGKEKHKNDDGEEEERDGKQDVSGTITIPEVAHDTEEDEFVFEIEIHSSTTAKEPAKALIRTSLTPKLRTHLRKIGPALIAEHGKDIQHAPGTNPSASFAPVRTLQNSGVNKGSSNTSSTTSTDPATGKKVNTTSLSDTQEFRTTAEQLYETFTSQERISAFTRGVPKRFDGAKEGGKFEIFGGNVSGEYTKLEKPTLVEQKWRLAQWPAGHFSTLKIRFEQNDVDAVTVMRVSWEGVPVGQEESTKRNWDEYYVRSIKQTFGFGTIL